MAAGASDGQQAGGPVGLGPADVVELDVGAALEAVLEVPGRLSVPPEDDPRGRPAGSGRGSVDAASERRPAVPCRTSSGRSTAGQSFQIRSSE